MEGKKRTGIVFVMILVTFIICFCFTGCGNPEDAAVKFLDALKAGDQETAQSFAEEDVIDDNLDLTKEVKGIMDGIDIFYDTLGLEIPDEIKPHMTLWFRIYAHHSLNPMNYQSLQTMMTGAKAQR